MDRLVHFTNDDLGLPRTLASYVLRSANKIMGNSLVCLLYGLVKSAHGDGRALWSDRPGNIGYYIEAKQFKIQPFQNLLTITL
jgi:hypothetical protein